MPSMRRSMSKSRKLNAYQKAVHKYKKQIASYAAKKGIKFMAAAAMMLKQKSKSKSRKMRKSKSRSRKSKSLKMRKSKSRSRKSKSRSRKSKSRSRKSKSRSGSRKSCGKGMVYRKAHRSVSDRRRKGKMVKGACVRKSVSRK